MMPAKTCVQRNSRLSHSLRVGSRIIRLCLSFVLCTWFFVLGTRTKHKVLTATISRIAVRTDQKWNMIVLGSIVNVEDHCHLWIEAGDAQRREIRFGIKNQPVSAVAHRAIDEKEWLDAPVGVGPCMAQLGPTFVSVLNLQTNSHTTCRSSP